MSDNNEIAIKVENLTKAYKLYNKASDRLKEALNPLRKSYHKDFYALKDVSFEIPKGQIVGIIGKNGSGKSTLLKILTGVLTPTSGSVSVKGKIAALLELGAGFNPEMTGYENIFFNGALMGFTRDEMERKVPKILEFADIGDFIHQPVRMYSSGMFARLAFSVAINVEPDILIIDEALSVGDYMFQFKCMQKIQSMSHAGVTILYVSHSTQSVIQNCDSAMLIMGGQLLTFSNSVHSVVLEYEELGRKSVRVRSKDLLIGTQEIRLGTQKARIEEVIFTQEEHSHTLWSGKNTSVTVNISADQKYPNVVLGMSIRTADGLILWGDNSMNAIPDRMSLNVGANLFVFEFDLNIQSGEYIFYIGLADISNRERVELDQRWGMRKIQILSLETQAEGFAYSPLSIVKLNGVPYVCNQVK